ncbi:hypothetical protein EYC84_001886 [Monilinia fructicola]|uniref:Uncharacterized protein n=1 Tax=Monilinia fructicola TaxID=38448 RepID=A0A5M9JRN9_MONFR|nr:hypothetical protein EYC84_001886 [Monilinia fructicola]
MTRRYKRVETPERIQTIVDEEIPVFTETSVLANQKMTHNRSHLSVNITIDGLSLRVILLRFVVSHASLCQSHLSTCHPFNHVNRNTLFLSFCHHINTLELQVYLFISRALLCVRQSSTPSV